MSCGKAKDVVRRCVTFGCGSSPETGAVPSLQATQMKLKRARLADNLNEKIAQRPGPMELVEKNILPVDSSLKEAIIGERRCRRRRSDGAGSRFLLLTNPLFYLTVVRSGPGELPQGSGRRQPL